MPSSTPLHAATGINQQINFQGRLLNAAGAVVADGTYNMEFKIYQDGTGTVAGNPGGFLKWTEDWVYGSGSPDNRVTVRNGYFSVALGSVTAFGGSIDWNQDTLWLSANIGNTSTAATFGAAAGDGEMLPMKRLSSAAYALQAANAGQLGGLTSGQYVQLAQGVQTDSSTNAAVFLNKTSTGNLLELQRGGADAFTVDNTGNIVLGSNADKTISIATAAASTAGNKLTLQAGTGGSGTGSAGGLLVLQGGTAGGTNANGGDVMVYGGAKTGSGTAGNVVLAYNGTSAVGSVGIGKAASSSYALDVAGDVNVSSGSAYRINGTTVCSGTTCTPAAGSGSYIQNGSSLQSSSNFHISGSGTADTSLLAPTIDTPSGTTTLNVGTNNATVGINLNQNTTIASGKTLTVGGAATFQNSADSTTALVVKTSTGGTNESVLQVDTLNERVGIGVMPIVQAKLNVVTGSTTGLLVFQNGTSDIADFTTGGVGVGTVTVGSGSATITGSGTAFTTNFKVGDGIYVASAAPQIRTIATITSNTAMTAGSNFSSGTSGLAYTLGALGAGTVTTNGTVNLVGSGTSFTTFYHVGDTILVNGETARIVNSITDNTHLAVTGAFSTSASSLAYMRAGTTNVSVQVGGTGVGTTAPQAALHVVPAGVAQKGLIVQAASGQTANLLEIQNSGGTAVVAADGSGNVTLAGNLTDSAAATWSTSSGDLSIQAAGNLNLGNGGGTTLNLGTNNTAHTIGVGTGAAGSNISAVTIGSNNAAASTTTIQGGNGSGAVSIQSAASGTIAIGTANAANTIQIGNIANALTQTINIGNNATASANSLVAIGSTIDGSTTTIQAGTGNLTLLTNSASAKVIVKSSTNTVTAFQVQDSNANPVVNVDTTNQRLGLNTNAPSGLLQVNQGTLAPGTVTNSASSAAVTGSSTTFTTTFTPGDAFTITSSGNTCTILSITDNTHLTCAAALSGSSSGSAYTLGNSARLTVLQNGSVGIGTSSPTNPLHVAVNNAATAAPIALLQNAGTGDTTMEFKSASSGGSFYIGQDASNTGAFTLNSSTAATSGNITLVQSSTGFNDASVSSVTATFGSSVAVGHLIMATAAWGDSGGVGGTLTCSDDKGNSYTTLDTRYDSTNHMSFGTCYAVSASNTTPTVTESNSVTGNFHRLIIHDYSGTATSSPIDVHAISAVTAGSTGTDAITSGSVTTTQAGDLIFGGVYEDTNLTSITPGTGFTNRVTLGSADLMNSEDKIQSGAGSVAATWTFSNNQTYMAAIVAIKAAPVSLTDTYQNALLAVSQTGGTVLRNSLNSTAEFQVQTASGSELFQVDSSNLRVYVGNPTADSTGTLLVVDTSTNTTEPTGVNGAIYYTTAGIGGADGNGASYSGKFRCYEGGAWKNCIGMRDIAERRWGLLSTPSLAATAPTASGGITLPAVAAAGTGDATNAESAYVKYTTGAVAGNGSGLNSAATAPTTGFTANTVQAEYRPKLVARIRTGSSVSSERMWVGLSDRAFVGNVSGTAVGFDPTTSNSTAETGNAASTNYLGLGYSSGVNSGIWVCGMGNGTNHSGVSTGVAVTASHYYDIILDYTTQGQLICSISDNGGVYTTVLNNNSTAVTETANLGLTVGNQTTNTTAKTIETAYTYLEYN